LGSFRAGTPWKGETGGAKMENVDGLNCEHIEARLNDWRLLGFASSRGDRGCRWSLGSFRAGGLPALFEHSDAHVNDWQLLGFASTLRHCQASPTGLATWQGSRSSTHRS
jgi:hypothetical protein